jgi:hypothetical protein
MQVKRTRAHYQRVRKHLNQLAPKLIIGHAYLRARSEYDDIMSIETSTTKSIRKCSKFIIAQQWKNGIHDVYRRLQAQRDRQDLSKACHSLNLSVPIQSLPDEFSIVNDIPECDLMPPCKYCSHSKYSST